MKTLQESIYWFSLTPQPTPAPFPLLVWNTERYNPFRAEKIIIKPGCPSKLLCTAFFS